MLFARFKIVYAFIFSILYIEVNAQRADSALLLADVKVTGYINRQSLMTIPGAVSMADTALMHALTGHTLLPALNVLPGIRMEERSPASYRLSLRGSLMRSPFGVRNVKVYLRDFPLTDAGGNTYLNILSRNAIENIEVLKGPDGSLFGANSGGVVILNADVQNFPDALKVEVRGGSFRLFEESILWRKNTRANALRVTQSYEAAENYRKNSASKRFFIDVNNNWTYAKNSELQFLALFANLEYQTPGGLTLEQMAQNPHQARPATNTLPGSAEQKAGTVNKYFFTGILHKTAISATAAHVLSFFGANADYRNRFVTNYETRAEPTLGWRTYFTFKQKNKENNGFAWKYIIGSEGAHTKAKIANFDNEKGIPGKLQSAADITTLQHFYFNKLDFSLREKFFAEAALSFNFYKYFFRDNDVSRRFTPQWMPRVAFSYKLIENIVWRASVGKGYAAPTTAEIRPSDNEIYDRLQPEYGWNYETGIRVSALKGRLFLDGSVFRFGLRNAIVRQSNEAGAEYFVNAGKTRQTGIELFANYKMAMPDRLFLKKVHISSGFTSSFFYFDEYVYDGNDYTGNFMTGVPKVTWVNTFAVNFPKKISLSFYHNYTSALPLNDANDVFAEPYHLVQAKLGKTFVLRHFMFTLHAGADNLLDAKYSLGNDLNAFGRRYYNPAAPRSYWLGLQLRL